MNSGWIRLALRCWPAGWRERHGAEIAEMTQESGRILDVVDLAGHGLETRIERMVRWMSPLQRRSAARLAVVALLIESACALALVERTAPTPALPLLLMAIVSGLLAAFGQDGIGRAGLLLTALACVALVPAAALLGWNRPPLFMLASFAGLAVTANLARMGVSTALRRWLMLALVGVVLVAVAVTPIDSWSSYRSMDREWLTLIQICFLIAVFLVAMVGRRLHRLPGIALVALSWLPLIPDREYEFQVGLTALLVTVAVAVHLAGRTDRHQTARSGLYEADS